MHVGHSARARALVQVIDVLGAEEHPLAEARLELRQGPVSRVGLLVTRGQAPLGLEPPDEQGVPLECARARDLLDPVSVPEAADAAKGGDAALGADPRAGQHEDARAFTTTPVDRHPRSLSHGTPLAIPVTVTPGRTDISGGTDAMPRGRGS